VLPHSPYSTNRQERVPRQRSDIEVSHPRIFPLYCEWLGPLQYDTRRGFEAWVSEFPVLADIGPPIVGDGESGGFGGSAPVAFLTHVRSAPICRVLGPRALKWRLLRNDKDTGRASRSHPWEEIRWFLRLRAVDQTSQLAASDTKELRRQQISRSFWDCGLRVGWQGGPASPGAADTGCG
jgi:hypothetical protein